MFITCNLTPKTIVNSLLDMVSFKLQENLRIKKKGTNERTNRWTDEWTQWPSHFLSCWSQLKMLTSSLKLKISALESIYFILTFNFNFKNSNSSFNIKIQHLSNLNNAINFNNKIGLLLCHSHIELRLLLRLSWGWGWFEPEVEMKLRWDLVEV